MAQFQYYTAEVLEKLKAELHQLKIQGRSDMAKQIAEALGSPNHPCQLSELLNPQFFAYFP